MNKSILFLFVLFIAVVGYPYLSTISTIDPALITGGILEGAATVVVLLYAVFKFKGSSERSHNYSSAKGVKKAKNKKNPFFLD